MEREKQLEFCKQCSHRKMDFKVGLLCGLTDKRADFKIVCPDFVEDPVERAKIDAQRQYENPEFNKSVQASPPSTLETFLYLFGAIVTIILTIIRCVIH